MPGQFRAVRALSEMLTREVKADWLRGAARRGELTGSAKRGVLRGSPERQ